MPAEGVVAVSRDGIRSKRSLAKINAITSRLKKDETEEHEPNGAFQRRLQRPNCFDHFEPLLSNVRRGHHSLPLSLSVSQIRSVKKQISSITLQIFSKIHKQRHEKRPRTILANFRALITIVGDESR